MSKGFSAVCVALGAASVAHAGAVVDLVPRLELDATFAPGEVVTMDVFLTQYPAGPPRGLRLVQFDFADTDPALLLEDRIAFNGRLPWRGLVRYFVDSNWTGQPTTASLAYTGLNYPNENSMDPDFVDPDPGSDPDPWDVYMVLLRDAATIRIADINVTMPLTLDTYRFDVMNADESDPNHGAALSFGFGLNQSDPVTVWRAYRGELTLGAGDFIPEGGNFRFVPIPEPTTLALLAVGLLATTFRRRRAD